MTPGVRCGTPWGASAYDVAVLPAGPPPERPLRFQRPSLPSPHAIERYLSHARACRWYSNFGPCWELLRDRLGAATGTCAVPVSSCSSGLQVVLAALRRRGPRRATEVLVPSFAFPAPAQAIVWNGLRPVFVDVAPDHWHLDPGALADALEAGRGDIAAVLALSSFGTPPPPEVRDAWEAICADAGVPLLVDSAAGFGAVAADERPIGAQGTAEVVSFHATKPMAAGEGGAMLTRDPELAEEVRRLGNFAFDADHEPVSAYGTNAKLGEPACAIALAALDGLSGQLTARRQRAARLLAALPGLQPQGGHEHGVWQFVPVAAEDAGEREAVLAAAQERVELRTYYGALHRTAAFRACDRAGSLDVTESLAERMLSLPMAADLSLAELDRIVDVVVAGSSRARSARIGAFRA